MNQTWIIAIWKTNNCETAVTVIVFIFSYRWHQIMCYICKLIIKFLCFILVKLSVKRPDKLTLLTHFKSLVFVSTVSLTEIVFKIFTYFIYICCATLTSKSICTRSQIFYGFVNYTYTLYVLQLEHKWIMHKGYIHLNSTSILPCA